MRRDRAPGDGLDELHGKLDLALAGTCVELEHPDLDVERQIRRDGTAGDAHAPDRSRILESLHDARLNEPRQPVPVKVAIATEPSRSAAVPPQRPNPSVR